MALLSSCDDKCAQLLVECIRKSLSIKLIYIFQAVSHYLSVFTQ